MRHSLFLFGVVLFGVGGCRQASTESGQTDAALDGQLPDGGSDHGIDASDLAVFDMRDPGDETPAGDVDVAVLDIPQMDVALPDEVGGDLDPDDATDADVTVPKKDWNQRFLEAVEQHDEAALLELAAFYRGPECDAWGCVVLSSVPTEGQVAIRGCFNQWQEGTWMTPVPELPGYHYFVVPEATVQEVCEYRLHYGADWHDDLDNPYIRFSDVSINNAIYAPGMSRLARLKSVYSADLDNYRDIYVYLPKMMFEDASAEFPVMYMQDGFNVFKNPLAPFGSWDVDVSLDELIDSGALPPILVVGIDTSDRLNEYLYCPLSANIGGEGIQVDPKLDEYLLFVVQDLKPLVDSFYPTLSQRDWTGIGGSSLGGISSMYMAWKRPDVFGRVASFSGSYWIGEDEDSVKGDGGISFLDVLADNPPGPQHSGLRIYLDSGDLGATTYPYESDARVYTDWVRNALIRYGWSNRPEWDTDGDVFSAPADLAISTAVGDVPTLYWSNTLPAGYADWGGYLRPDLDLLHLVGVQHQHNEAAWKARFPAAMRYLWK